MADRPTITIRIDGEFDLDLEGTDGDGSVFPDGAPEGWTIDDVVKAIRSTGSVTRLISDWNLVPSVSVELTQKASDGHWDCEHQDVWL